MSVTVLLATYNGGPYLGEQLESIFGQRGVEVEVIASDDGSTDNTAQYLRDYTARENRLTVLPQAEPTGSAAGNFYRLLREVRVEPGVFYAFADQDDIWFPDKLARHAQIMVREGADGVSSSVNALYPGGNIELVRKDYPERELDFLAQSPGPGCSHLLSGRLVEKLQWLLAEHGTEVEAVEFHDWLDYAVARSSGWKWVIDSEPSLLYRQHASNVIGANAGAGAALRRARRMADRWHRGQCLAITRVCLLTCAPPLRGALERAALWFSGGGPRERLAMARSAGRLRRRRRDALILGFTTLVGLW